MPARRLELRNHEGCGEIIPMYSFDSSGGSRLVRIMKNIRWLFLAYIFIQLGYIFYFEGWPLYINNVSFADVATKTINQMFAPDGAKTFNTFWGTQMTVEVAPTQNTFILVIPKMPASVCKEVESRINHGIYVSVTPCNSFTPSDVTYKYIGN